MPGLPVMARPGRTRVRAARRRRRRTAASCPARRPARGPLPGSARRHRAAAPWPGPRCRGSARLPPAPAPPRHPCRRPGAASYQADQQILRDYGNGGPGYPEVVVVRLPPGRAAAGTAGRRALGAAFAAVAARPGLRVADYASTGDRGFLTADPRLSYGLVFTPYTGELSPPSLGPPITAAMRPALPPGSMVAVTGMNELASGGQARGGFGVLAETLLAGAAALGVPLFVFGSALAGRPPAVAAVGGPRPFRPPL